MSMGFLVDQNDAIVWRGLMVGTCVKREREGRERDSFYLLTLGNVSYTETIERC